MNPPRRWFLSWCTAHFQNSLLFFWNSPIIKVQRRGLVVLYILHSSSPSTPTWVVGSHGKVSSCLNFFNAMAGTTNSLFRNCSCVETAVDESFDTKASPTNFWVRSWPSWIPLFGLGSALELGSCSVSPVELLGPFEPGASTGSASASAPIVSPAAFSKSSKRCLLPESLKVSLKEEWA